MVKQYHRLMLALLKTNDLLISALAWASAYGTYNLFLQTAPPDRALGSFSSLLPVLVLALVLSLFVFAGFSLYEPKRTRPLPTEMLHILRAVLLAWGLTYIFTTLMDQDHTPRLLMLLFLAFWSVLALLNRGVVRLILRWFRRHGWNQRTAAIIGDGRLAQKLYHTLNRHLWTGITPQYFIGQTDKVRKLFGLEVLGPTEAVEEILLARPVDIAFVAIPGQNHHQVGKVLYCLSTLPVEIRVVPDLLSFHFLKHDVSQLDDIPIITMTYNPQQGTGRILKRIFDIVVSATALAILALPIILMALAVKLTSRGPVFYRQIRASLDGQPFRIIKFRTMKENSESQTGPIWAAPDDSRVTKLGRFLRRTSLDELPQLFNVLVGHMSLVGPRPERPELIERFRQEVPRYMLRHHVKAGLVGWAQIHGLRGRTSLHKRVQYDLYYITNWSFGLDLRILFMTPFRGLINRNAY